MSEPAKPIVPMTPQQERIGRRIIRIIGRWQVRIYRLSQGRLGKTFNGGPVGLLTFTGRRSKQLRTLPLVYAKDGDRVWVGATQGGMSTHPLWYHSLREYPDVWFQIGAEKRPMRVRDAEAAELEDGWGMLCAVYPEFSEYRQRAALSGRTPPLLVLEPNPTAAST